MVPYFFNFERGGINSREEEKRNDTRACVCVCVANVLTSDKRKGKERKRRRKGRKKRKKGWGLRDQRGYFNGPINSNGHLPPRSSG